MPNLKITQKLGLVISGFAALCLFLTVIGMSSLNKFEQDLERIVSVARPMNNAAYEMQINVVEVGMRIVKYLQRSDAELRAQISDDVADFDRFHVIYASLAFTGDQKKLAAEANKEFRDYLLLGNRMLDNKDIFHDETTAVAQSFLEMEAITDEEMERLKNEPNASREVIGGFTLLRIELVEALSLLRIAEYSDSGAGLSALEGELTHILVRLNALNTTAVSSEASVEVRDIFIRAAVHLQLLVNSVKSIESDYLKFIEHHRILDEMLDNDIQIKTAEYLQAISADQREMISLTNKMLITGSVLWMILTIGVMFYVSRGIAAPVQQLSEAAEILAAGDFSHRIAMRRRDELGVLGAAFDTMAERLQLAYTKLSQTNAELDQKVEIRTEELSAVNDRLQNELVLHQQTEQELRDAIEAANAASESKTLFLGNMSHELRTPLNAIIGFSDVIIHEMFGPVGNAKYADYAIHINQSGVHLLALINELLDVARIESGKLTLTEEEFDLPSVLETCLHMHSEIASKRQVFLVRNIDDNLPFMFGDQTRVKQIFTNLIGNAVKFTPPEGSVKLSAKRGSDGSLVLSVADTGIGIAPENISRVFETFGQVANVLTRAHEGAGLGLPLAKILTERHDGVLEVTSELGLGTTVTVTFPASRAVLSGDTLKRVA